MNVTSAETATLNFIKKLVKNTEYEGKVFLAGGAVRDFLLQIPIKDLDFVVEQNNGGIEFANWVTNKLGVFKEESNPVVFQTYGTAKFNLRGIEHKGHDLSEVDIECVMPRGERYEEGNRKPEVFDATLEDDVFRRDFTVNSLLYDISTDQILDFTKKGVEHILGKVIDTALEPGVIFKDDPLRQLRAIRFAAKFGWRIADRVQESIKVHAPWIQSISSERIQEELNKILVSSNPVLGIKLIQEFGLSQYIFPELDENIGVEQNAHHKDDVMNHILEVVSNSSPILNIRLAALFHDIAKKNTKSVDEDGRIHFYQHELEGAKMAEEIMQRLKYSNDQIKSVKTLVKTHMRLKQAGPEGDKISDKALRKYLRDVKEELEDSLDLIHADNISHAEASNMPNQIPNITERINNLDYTFKSKLPITGNDIIERFNLGTGPIIGTLINAAKDEFLSNPKVTKEELFNKLENVLLKQFND